MVSFSSFVSSVPVFQVSPGSVAFAGSRHGSLPSRVTGSLVHVFGALGFSFLTGCAPGVDASFRKAFTASAVGINSFVACAFEATVRRCACGNLSAGRVVPDGLTPAAALHRRTVWMVRRASLLVLFPENPETGLWGRGSTLACRTARYNLVPAFVVTVHRPKPGVGFLVAPATLFGIVEGYWIFPHPVREGGPCEDTW